MLCGSRWTRVRTIFLTYAKRAPLSVEFGLSICRDNFSFWYVYFCRFEITLPCSFLRCWWVKQCGTFKVEPVFHILFYLKFFYLLFWDRFFCMGWFIFSHILIRKVRTFCNMKMKNTHTASRPEIPLAAKRKAVLRIN